MLTYANYNTYEDRGQKALSTFLGGDIVSIASRQAIRLKAIYNRKAFLAQQARLRNINDATGNPVGWIADIPITVRTQEVYNYTAEATQYPVESGAIISDHVILKPLVVDISFELSNLYRQSATESMDLLEKMWAGRVPLDLITKHKKIPNMVMVRLNMTNSAPFWGRVECKATFQQIGTGVLEVISVKVVEPADKSSGPTAAQSAKPTQQTKIAEINKTYMKELLDGSFGTVKAIFK